MPITAEYGKGYLYNYHCTVCDKKIQRWTGNEPMSGIMPDVWSGYKKDPLNNVSPPIIRSDD